MQVLFDLIQKIPAGWPRWLVLAAVVIAYFFFPDIVRKLRGKKKQKETLERLTQFLQIRKLLLDLEILQKEKNLSRFEFPGEARLLAELSEAEVVSEKSKEPVTYVGRLKFSLLGGAVFFLIATLLFAFGRFQEPASAWDTVKFLVRDLVFSVACGLLASFIPLGSQRASFVYGFTMPLAVVLLILTVTH
jgi:hypothetical protein